MQISCLLWKQVLQKSFAEGVQKFSIERQRHFSESRGGMSAEVEVPLSTADLDRSQKNEESVFVEVKTPAGSAENREPAALVAMETAEKRRLQIVHVSRAKKRAHSTTATSHPLEQAGNGGGPHRHPLKKRCFTTTGDEKDKFVLHNKFLMGGNLSDPLNLNSLLDPNASPVVLSPMPSPLSRGKETLPVVVPKDITDPLKLNVSDAELGQDLSKSLISPTICPPAARKRKRHSKSKGGGPGQEARKRKEEVGSGQDLVPPDGGAALPRLSPKEVAGPTDSIRQEGRDRVVSPVTDEKKLPPAVFRAAIVSPVSTKPRGGGAKKPEPTAKVSRGLLKEDSTPKGARKERGRKFDRHTSREPHLQFSARDQRFQYGNYNRYYGYRNPPTMSADPRLAALQPDWFRGKTCLDIGCNVGHLTITVAKQFEPKQITGIDIDGNLIGVARKNIRHYLSPTRADSGRLFPASLKCYGPIVAPRVATASSSKKPSGNSSNSLFPNNIFFKRCNYVLEDDSQLAEQRPDFNTILCLSTTKWVHLNWGDEGLKRLFKRVARALLPDGHFLLEPQPWSSYGKKKKLTETIYKNYQQIKFRPEQFSKYLLSPEIGFKTCEELKISDHYVKGFQRPLLLFTK